MASLIYDATLDHVVRAEIDFADDAFKCLLVTAGYMPDKTTHVHRSDVTNEVAASGSYVAGGLSADVDVINAAGTLDITLGAVSATNATITARGAVYYKDTGNAGSDALVAYIDFGSDVTSTAGTFSLTASTLRLQN